MKKSILIIDGNNLAKRVGYSHKNLGFFSEEENTYIYTGMIYGFITNILFLSKEIKPSAIIIVWDGGSKIRTSIFPGYKRKRKKNKVKEEIQRKIDLDEYVISDDKKNTLPPHDFKKELLSTMDCVTHIGLQQLHMNDEEADDIIGTLVKKHHKEYKIYISSNDQDFNQLLKYDGVILYRSYGNKREFYNREKFIKEYEFEPSKYTSYLALAGDRTDEYPGVRGIGHESAIQIVREHSDIGKIIELAKKDQLDSRFNNMIRLNEEMAWICYKLAKIRKSVVFNSYHEDYNEEKFINDMKKYRCFSLTFEEKLEQIRLLPKKKII